MRSRSPRSWPLDCAEWLAARRCRVRTSCVNARRPWRAAARLRCLCRRWCSGRRRARSPARSPHASFARSGRSRSPPVPSRPSGALHTSGTRSLMCGASTRCPSRPCRRPPAPRPGPAGPSGALHTGGAVSLMCGALARNPARPRRRLRNFARNSPGTISGFEL